MESTMTVIGILSGIISLFFLVYKPLNAFSVALKENTLNMKNLSNSFEEFKKEMDRRTEDQQDSLRELDKKNEEQDDKITNHEMRIKIIEREVGIDGRT